MEDLKRISRLQYRGRKDGDWSSNFMVDLVNGEQRSVPRMQSIRQALIHFVRERCSMCIDWSSELADISVGDHWESPTGSRSYHNRQTKFA